MPYWLIRIAPVNLACHILGVTFAVICGPSVFDEIMEIWILGIKITFDENDEGSLALDSSETLMLRLIDMASNQDPDVRVAVLDAMQRFSDGRVVAPLAAALEDDDSRVALQAKRSLDHLESVVARKVTSSDQ